MKPQILLILPFLLVMASCGSGSGPVYNASDSASSSSASSSASSSSASSSSGSAATGDNFAQITVDSGPVVGGGSANVPYVSVTLCVPGTTTCQTIDHIILDTGSVGLRIQGEVLNASLRKALPGVGGAGKEIAECYQYADGFVFGSVRSADMRIGGEAVSGLPLMVINDDGDYQTVPSSCSATGGVAEQSVASFGANGILGIGSAAMDCGNFCATHTGYYYQCSASGCTPSTLETASQLPNPVARMNVDNNGTVIVLPQVAANGAQTLTGRVYFGIGTQSNNGLGGRTPLKTDDAGDLTASLNGQVLSDSFLDSGTNTYLFDDATITVCTDSDITGFYCPTSALSLTATLTGTNGASQSGRFDLYNARTLFDSGNVVLPGLGASPSAAGISFSSMDLGLPFFFGRSVYTAISGKLADGTVGPYVAF